MQGNQLALYRQGVNKNIMKRYKRDIDKRDIDKRDIIMKDTILCRSHSFHSFR